MITVFKNYSNTTNPKYFDIDVVLQQIKDCKLQNQINEIRECNDEAKKKELKKMLPCILFSGTFTKRKDKSLKEHSGFVILDWDKLDDVDSKKNELKKHSFIYSLFVSPSGDGLKGVVRIPREIENHRGYYRGLMALFPELDATSINESRICYASCDSEIYINKDATVFTNFIEDKKEEGVPAQIDSTKERANNKIDIALNLIKNSVDGEKHHCLLKASRLMGGFIQGGLISESLAINLLEQEISNRGVVSLKDAQTTILKGIEHGKNSPIEIEVKQNYNSKVKSSISLNDETFDFLADKDEVNEYLAQWRSGTFEKGLTTGIPSFDKYFLFKRGNFNVVNGFDNVGKSTALWYLTLLSSLFHGWRWILCSNENRNGAVVKRLIEFYHGEPIDKQSEEQFQEALKFVNEHFTIISNKTLLNFKDVLNITEKLMTKKKYDGLLVDPYNSLKIDLSSSSKLSTHEYHYEAASEMQIFAKTFDICVYLNCHVITGAMRLQKGETKHKAPSKADTEGGGKFSNKADDFMTFHREPQDKENFTKMQIHVRKIKEVETGGGYTPYDEPYILDMQKGMCRYADESGFDPVRDYWMKKNRVALKEFIETPKPLTPSLTFEEEVDKMYNSNEYLSEPPF